MNKVRKRSRLRYRSANDWPSTPEIDGIVWFPTEPPRVSEPDIPDEVWQERADLAAEENRLERGVRFF